MVAAINRSPSPPMKPPPAVLFPKAIHSIFSLSTYASLSPLQFVRRFLRVPVLHSAAPSSLCKQSSHGRIGYRGVAQSWSPVCHYRASTRVLKIELFRFPFQWNCRSRLLIDRNPLRLCQPLPIGTRVSPNWDFERLNRRDTRNQGPEDRSEEHTSELQSLRHLVCRLL